MENTLLSFQNLIDTDKYDLDIAQEGFFDRVISDKDWVTIKSFPVSWFIATVRETYGTKRLANLIEAIGIRLFGRSTIKIHNFFIPELVYVLNTMKGPKALINEIVSSTWVKQFDLPDSAFSNRCDLVKIAKDMPKMKLYPWQKEFIEEYDIRRQRYSLNGNLLSFGCGLGKTITALALTSAIAAKKVIIIAPKSTLADVWKYHINEFYADKQSMWMIGDGEPTTREKFFIVNYESMAYLTPYLKGIARGGDVAIIVDESHNFLSSNSARTKNLIYFRNTLQTKDVLLMSGTPLKAVGVEMIPLLHILDDYFTDEAEEIFRLALGVNSNMATDILHSRMQMIMHRRTKEEVLKLPEKTEQIVNVRLPGGGLEYTASQVSKRAYAFIQERYDFHMKNMSKYLRTFDEAIDFYVSKSGNTRDLSNYLKMVKYLRENGYNRADRDFVKKVTIINAWEKQVLEPTLPSKLRNEFRFCKSAVKYLPMKIQGEVLGGLLNQLRSEMTNKMLATVDLKSLIESTPKKAVIFTSYVETAEIAYAWCKKVGFEPIICYGANSSDIPANIAKFRKDPDANPLIATIQTLATGVTLLQASRVIFLNPPWRDADKIQASERVHRIGQDTPVTIIILRLDTGNEDNLSTRMEEILTQTREITDQMIDGKFVASSGTVKSLFYVN